MKVNVQIDLFAPKPRNVDEAALIKRLREAASAATGARPNRIDGLSDAQLRRLMRPLPRITALD
jgi:hypothetical protein